MAEEKQNKTVKQTTKNPLIGAQTQPTTLDTKARLDVDIDQSLIDNIIDAGLSNQLDTGALESFTSISNARDQIYQLIDTMGQDSTVAAIVRTYAEDACEPADNGHIVWCESDDPNISKFVNYILNSMNVDKHIYGWAYSLVKYGDVYLKLYRESDYKDPLFHSDNIKRTQSAKSILNEEVFKKKNNLDEAVYLSTHEDSDKYSLYIEAVPDPGTMFELTKYGMTYGFIETPNSETGMDYLTTYFAGTDQMNSTTGTFNYKMKTTDVIVHQADDFVHACLDDEQSRYPEKIDIFLNDDDYTAGTNAQSYSVRRGKSMLYDSYKVWREKSLLEASILLNRITKSSIVRTIQVEVGNMSKDQARNTMRRIKELMEQKSAINTGTGMVEYNNPGPIENNVYLPIHNGHGSVSIGTVGGDADVKGLADLDNWVNKFYAGFGVPKQYFGYCLRGDTKITLLDGEEITIKQLFENKEQYIGKGILGCGKDGTLIPTTISNIMLTKPSSDFIRIQLGNGNYVDVTPEHRMMLRDGTFVEAKDIKVGDRLMPYYERMTNEGRKQVLDNKSGKYRPLFQVVAESKYGEPEKGYQIHHLDENKLNDDFDNLEKLTTAEHFRADSAYKADSITEITYDCQLDSCVPECNHTVTAVEYLNVQEPAYDISVTDDCHTFPLTAGIFVHNCDDGAGFNGGSSLTILSSIYAKGVKKIQNALIQALTTAVDLILINRGCNAYRNNFVLKMKIPVTQEEKDYREQLTQQISAISNMQSLFGDIEDKTRRLEVLKVLVKSLNYGDELINIVDKEIDETETQKRKEAEEAAAAAEEEARAAALQNAAPSTEDTGTEESSSEEPPVDIADLDLDLDLGSSSQAPTESFRPTEGTTVLTESPDVVNYDDDLPLPEELDAHKDFTKNE